jgi:hypothetical protein
MAGRVPAIHVFFTSRYYDSRFASSEDAFSYRYAHRIVVVYPSESDF